MSTKKVILITGASAGIGRVTAEYLARQGYIVYGTSRHPEQAKPLPGVQFLPLDLGSTDSVKSCIQTIVAQTGRLDVLMNNAGYLLVGPSEEVTLEEAKAHLETHLFGTMRTVKAALPIMREQGGGQIINISAIGGIIPVPFMGIQSATKFALEGYTETLRYEVKPFNIGVSLVQLGPFKTSLFQNRQHTTHSLRPYDPWRAGTEAFLAQANNAPTPEKVAALIGKIITSKRPKVRYGAGMGATIIPFLRRFLPAPLFERVLRKVYTLDSVKYGKTASPLLNR